MSETRMDGHGRFAPEDRDRECGCESARLRISATHDGEMREEFGEDSQSGLSEHLSTCEECRRFAARVSELSAAFAPLRALRPAEGLEARLLERIPESRRVVPMLVLRRLVAGGLGLAAGILLVVGLSAWLAGPEQAVREHAVASWLEPLEGRALHRDDAALRTWPASVANAMAAVASEERR